MNRGSKIMLGIFTFMPLLLLLVYISSIGYILKDTIFTRGESFPFIADIFWIVTIALLMGLLSLGLLIYYIIHVINNQYIESNEKLLWVLSFILGSFASFPIYWYLRIWKGPEIISMSAT